MPTSHEKPRELKARLAHELKSYAWLSGYLFLLLFALTAFRARVEGRDAPSLRELGHAVFEALVLGKVILIGGLFGIGERLRHGRLVTLTIYRAAAYALFALAFFAAEDLITGLIKGQGFRAIVEEARRIGFGVMLMRCIIMFIFLVPLFAIWGLARRLGPGRLHELFFSRGDEEPGPHRG